MDDASALLARPSDVTEKAMRLPEVLACVFSWLSNDKRALRSVRLVSKYFHAIANQVFWIHLHAEYAMKHNCIQEAASIIGGLTVTFRDVKPPSPQYLQSMDELDEGIPEELPEVCFVDTAFCSLVAQSCVHLERLVIVLEGSKTEQVPLLLSALLSQNLEKPAVFRIKDLQLTLSSNFAQSVRYEVPQMQLHEATSNLSWTTPPNYAPTESSLAQLEKLTLQMSFLRVDADIYKVLQLKLCPEITIATSFLGPVLNLNLKEGSPMTEFLITAPTPSRTFKTLECYTTTLNIDQIFRLRAQAPAFEDLRMLAIFTFDRTFTVSAAFARASARQAGSLCLKQLRLVSCTDRYASLLLGRLLDPTTLESFYVDYLYPNVLSMPDAGEEHPGKVLKDFMEEMRGGQLSGWPQWGSMREFGIRKLNSAINRIDWLRELRTIPRFSRLEKITLPISVHEFVEIFVKSALIETEPTGHEIGSSSLPPPSQLPFPACSSLLSVNLHGGNSRTNEASDVPQFANYLTCWLPQLRHLHIKEGYFLDLSFLDAIAPPPRPSSLSPVSTLPSSLQTGGQMDCDKFVEDQKHIDSHDSSSSSSRNSDGGSIGNGGSGLYRLESLSVSFEFLSQSEFLGLPRSEHLLKLQDEKADLATRRLQYSRGTTGLFDYQEVEKLILAEEQRMVLDARPIQVHEDRVDQILAFLGRFQETGEGNRDIGVSAVTQRVGRESKPPVSGLKEITFTQTGMPKQYLNKLEHQVKTLYPEIKWTSNSTIHRLPDRN